MGICVGIDLGTTRSVIAYLNSNKKPEAIRNESGHVTTPSMIYFSPEGPVIGEAAKARRKAGFADVVQLFKRNIDNEHFLFSAGGRDYTPVDLSALLLSFLKKLAENSLHETVTDAVITVPAYFTDPQRKATIVAGEQAGLHVLKIISEPTAAALAYSSFSSVKDQRILVFDLGGGTFDISLVDLVSSAVHVLGTDGNHRLGGVDWDASLLSYVAQQFEQQFDLKLTGEERELWLDTIEQAKHNLSVRQRTTITVKARNQTGSYTVTRAQFEDLTRNLMAEIEMLTGRLLSAKGLHWIDLDGVLLVGGASRMPMVRSYVERMTGKPAISSSNPDEIVAIGAALQAGKEMTVGHSPTMTEVIAHSLGMVVESADRSHYINSVIIPKDTSIPAICTRSYQMRLRRDGKTQLEVFLTQGEDANPAHCVYLGRYLFSNFPTLDQAIITLDITYQYDKNGVVHIAAVEHSTQQPLTLTIESKPANIKTRFSGNPLEKTRQDPMTIYLAFDLSGSMKGEPLEAAKRAALSFVERCRVSTISIGLVSFADIVHVHQEATADRDTIRHEIDKLDLDRAEGYGNNEDPFDELYRLLNSSWHLRYAVVLTDGAWARTDLALERARRCHAANIEVFAVGFGSANRDFLAQIASSAAQGILVDMNQLVEAFSTIAQEIVNTDESTTLREEAPGVVTAPGL